jgi:hypothetical protein
MLVEAVNPTIAKLRWSFAHPVATWIVGPYGTQSKQNCDRAPQVARELLFMSKVLEVGLSPRRPPARLAGTRAAGPTQQS